MYQQMMADRMAEEEEGGIMYADEDFDPEQIFAQIGLTPEQL